MVFFIILFNYKYLSYIFMYNVLYMCFCILVYLIVIFFLRRNFFLFDSLRNWGIMNLYLLFKVIELIIYMEKECELRLFDLKNSLVCILNGFYS